MLSDVIGSIYDCVLDPGKWAPTLESINREFTFVNSALGVVPLHGGSHVLNVTVGFDREWLEVGPSYATETVALWGGADRARQYPLDEPIVASQIPSYASRYGNRYFRDVLEPRGMLDAATIALMREPTTVGYVSFNRHQDDGYIGEREVTGLRLLGPHFRRAVSISSLFDLKAIETASFAAVLDGFAFGVLLVDEHLGIVHANPVAEQMLATRDPLMVEDGSLALRDEPATAALRRAVHQIGRDETRLGALGIGIPARRAEGNPCVVHVMPLRSRLLRSSVGQRATAALFVAPATAARTLPTEALALIYDLTPAETRILEMIVAGLTQSAIAGELGIAPSTVKTHLLRLFEKTGCKRQVDLVRLAAQMSRPG